MGGFSDAWSDTQDLITPVLQNNPVTNAIRGVGDIINADYAGMAESFGDAAKSYGPAIVGNLPGVRNVIRDIGYFVGDSGTTTSDGIRTGGSEAWQPNTVYRPPSYDGADKSFADIDPSDFQRDKVMQQRVEREAGIDESRMAGMMAQFEAMRNQMIARRNAAISAAGRGAAAPYNAAIRQIDEKTKQLQDQMPIVGDVYGQKIENQYLIYDRAASELGTSYDEALAYSTEVSDEQVSNIRSHFSQAQDDAAAVVEMVGGDKNTALEVAQEVGRMEESIITMSEVSAAGIQGIMQAAENLAVKSALAAGATNALELKRKQLDVELGIKEKLADLAEQRRNQIRARGAAVQSARAMAAARWPEGMPIDKSGFQQVAVAKYFEGQNINPEAGKLAADFVDMGMSHNDLRLVLNNTRNGVPNADATAILSKYNIDKTAWMEIPDEVIGDLGKAANGMEIYNTAGNEFESRFVGADPRNFEPNSAARAMAGAQWARDQGHSDKDAFHMGREIAETPDENLGALFDAGTFGTTPTYSVNSVGDSYTTIEQAKYEDAWRDNVSKFGSLR